MSDWSHLPNAKHIDRVIAALRANNKVWSQAWFANWCWGLSVARTLPLDEDQAQAWNATIIAVYDTELCSRHDPNRNNAAIAAAKDAILALIVYDDSAKYLELPLDQLKMLYALTEHPACLLQPAVQAFAMERELV
jgi:hypothetical protein